MEEHPGTQRPGQYSDVVMSRQLDQVIDSSIVRIEFTAGNLYNDSRFRD